MYRVLLVDDEPWALMGIRNTFKWEDQGFEVAAETTDPVEALEIICAQHPDVVFTDIRMPEINGIELMEKTRQRGIKSEFVLISGFADFTYAQKALQEGAFDYCLKPLEIDQAGKLLVRLSRHLYSKKKSWNMNMIETLMDSKLTIAQAYENAGSKCCHSNFQAVMIRYNHRINEAQETLCFPHDSEALCIQSGKNSLLYIINTSSPVDLYVTEWYEKQAYPYDRAVGISSVMQTGDKIEKLVIQADIASHCPFVRGRYGVFQYKRKEINAVKKTLEGLFSLVNNGQYDSLDKYWDDIPQVFADNQWGIEELVFLWNQTVAYITQRIPQEYVCSNLEFMNYEQIMEQFDSIETLCTYLKEAFINLNQEKAGLMDDRKGNESFKKLLEYVNENFHQKLYLRDLAAKFFLNANYCCNLFQKVTGCSFSGYITNLRMQKACELLRDQRYNIVDVSRKVGFTDYYYFAKVFKKHFDQTPSRYKAGILAEKKSVKAERMMKEG